MHSVRVWSLSACCTCPIQMQDTLYMWHDACIAITNIERSRTSRADLLRVQCRLVCAPAIRRESRLRDNALQPGEAAGDAAAAIAAEQAGQSLYERLLAVLAALLSGTWASWLHGDQVRPYIILLPPGGDCHRSPSLGMPCFAACCCL